MQNQLTQGEEHMRMNPGFEMMSFNSPSMNTFSMSSRMQPGHGNGTFQSTSVSYQTYYDRNGKQHTKKMQKSNNMHVDERGNVMEDREEMYKDSKQKINRIRKGRRMNDKGMQITKEKNNGDFNELKRFYNMDEEDMPEFIDEWRKKEKGIPKTFTKRQMVDNGNRMLQIGYQGNDTHQRRIPETNYQLTRPRVKDKQFVKYVSDEYDRQPKEKTSKYQKSRKVKRSTKKTRKN